MTEKADAEEIEREERSKEQMLDGAVHKITEIEAELERRIRMVKAEQFEREKLEAKPKMDLAMRDLEEQLKQMQQLMEVSLFWVNSTKNNPYLMHF